MVVYYSVLIGTWSLLFFANKPLYAKNDLAVSNKKSSNKILIALAFLILWLLCGLRYGIGTDYFSYKNIYETIVKTKSNSVNMEIGFYLLCRFIGFFNADYKVFFLITSFLSIIFVYLRIILDSHSSDLSIIVYLSSFSYFTTFNIVRQSIAMGIIFFGTRYLEKKQPIKYFIFLVIAILFHKTAIIGLAFYYIYYVRFNNVINLLIIITAPIALIALKDQFLNLLKLTYPSYVSRFEITPEFSALRISFEMVLLIISIYYFKFLRNLSEGNALVNCQAIILVFNIISFLIPYAHRIIMYFTFLQTLLVPSILKSIKFKSDKVIIGTFFVIYYLLYIYYSIKINNSGEILPYRWIFGVQ